MRISTITPPPIYMLWTYPAVRRLHRVRCLPLAESARHDPKSPLPGLVPPDRPLVFRPGSARGCSGGVGDVRDVMGELIAGEMTELPGPTRGSHGRRSLPD